MNYDESIILQIQPVINKRDCGGWIATSPKRAILTIGVTGSTEEDAREKFSDALKRWAADSVAEQR